MPAAAHADPTAAQAFDLIVGVDIGGTSTKVVVATPGGIPVHTRAGGGSLRSAGEAELSEALTSAIGNALELLSRGTGRHAGTVIGSTGAETGAREAIGRIAVDVWHTLGLTGPVEVCSDFEIAYASAATGGNGLLLLSGTGAVAAGFADFQMVSRCDGMGWLLGDTGSGLWLGMHAARAAAADLDGRAPATALTASVLDQFAIPADDPNLRTLLISAVHSGPVAQLAALAPLVSRLAGSDEVAGAIVAGAIQGLAETARVAARRMDTPPQEIVMAGSVLTNSGPVRDGLLKVLSADFPVPVADAAAPVSGALRRAARLAGWPAPEPWPTSD